MLIVGLVEITRRYATTSIRVKHAIEDTRATRLVQTLMNNLERADPETLRVTPTRVTAKVGAVDVAASLTQAPDGRTTLTWDSVPVSRTIRLRFPARFELHGADTLHLVDASGGPPLASTR
jgi:hypothetical protein